jgi:DNA-binding transcriptional LysR family regulator
MQGVHREIQAHMDLGERGSGPGTGSNGGYRRSLLRHIYGAASNREPALPRVRVLIAAMPPLLTDVVKGLVCLHPELDVIDDASGDVVEAVASHEADAVLTAASVCRAPEVTERLLYAHPRLRLLVLSQDGRVAHLYRLLPHEVRIDDVSMHELIHAIVGHGRYRAGANG